MKTIIRLMFIILIAFFINITVYAYTEYKVGDIVSYNDIEFYVIKDSSTDEDSVTMLKAEPLTVEEVNKYGGVGTDNNHVNKYSPPPATGQAYDINGYGGIAFYTSETCGLVDYWISSGCINEYSKSDIKYVVDAWANKMFSSGLVEARLLKIEELLNNFSYSYQEYTLPGDIYPFREGDPTDETPEWIYNEKFSYWIMDKYEDDVSRAWRINDYGKLNTGSVYHFGFGVYTVRPVVAIKKGLLDNVDDNFISYDNYDKEIISNNQQSYLKVKVANTYMSQAMIIIIVGFISICSGIVIYYIFRNRKIISRR